MKKIFMLTMVIIVICFVVSNSLAETFIAPENYSSQKQEPTNLSQKNFDKTETIKWFQENLIGINEVVLESDIQKIANELKVEIGLGENAINLLKEISVLESEKQQFYKELWYMDTLLERMPPEVRERRTEEDEKQRIKDIEETKRKIENIEIIECGKVNKLRHLLGEKNKVLKEWIEEKRKEIIRQFKEEKNKHLK